MTRARTRLVSTAEIRRVLAVLRQEGVPIGAVDIRADGVTVSPPGDSQGGTQPGTDFDRWQKQDAHRAGPAPH